MGDHRTRLHSHDAVVHQLHVVAEQRAEPAVVLQDPLAERRVVGQHLGHQVRSVGELALGMRGHHPAQLVVGG